MAKTLTWEALHTDNSRRINFKANKCGIQLDVVNPPAKYPLELHLINPNYDYVWETVEQIFYFCRQRPFYLRVGDRCVSTAFEKILEFKGSASKLGIGLIIFEYLNRKPYYPNHQKKQ